MEKIKEFFMRDKFARKNGIELIEVERGHAKAQMEINENHLNGIGTVHGGAIFTLADFAFAVAANSHGNITVAINVNISFVKAAYSGTLTAEAREITQNPKISTYTVDIFDSDGELIAIFQGMAYRKRERLEDLK